MDENVRCYPSGAILTTEQLADWLQVSPATAREMKLPRLNLPGKMVRHSAGAVLAYLEGR
jgi:hypothetical protein